MKSFGAIALLLMAEASLAAPAPRPAGFAMCGVCHKAELAGKNGIGPNLWGIAERTSGTVPGFAYSEAMKKAKVKWNKKELASFITQPQKHIPGNKMMFAGQKDPKKTTEIVNYLVSLK
jgi:cytochrome c